jgi:hypothetical protein
MQSNRTPCGTGYTRLVRRWKGPMPPLGTFETCQHVRSVVAIRGKADIEKAALNKGVSQVLAVATFLSAG